jgi:cobalamin biosynthesis Mg chelatase CobN
MKRTASMASIAGVVLVIMTLGQSISAQETEVEIRRGEVMQVVGNTVLIRVEGEGVKRYTIPRDFRFNYEGSQITVNELREGMILTGVRLRTTGSTEEEDITSAMEAVAEPPAAATEEEAAEAPEGAEMSAEVPATTGEPAEAESTEAPTAAATAAEATTEEAAASSEEAVGMSPALIVGLVLLVLILIVFAAKGLGSSEGKKAARK